MKIRKIRIRLTKNQEKVAWDMVHASRKFWNLLVDIDKRNLKGEFDEIFKSRGCKTYYSKMFDRDIYVLNNKEYLELSKIHIKELENNEWYFKPNQSFIFNTTL